MNFQQVQPEDLIGELNDVEQKNAPDRLFVAGDVRLFRYPRVSIVGTRKPSEEGKQLARLLVQKLVQQKIVIVSGLAEGIDTVAHTEAINCGWKTIGVIGTGLEVSFPKSNNALQNSMMREHPVVSQFEPSMRGMKASFPQRNRTMALLSDATIIIEAGEQSGTEHQGWEAIRLGRPLFISALTAAKGYDWTEKLRYYGAEILSDESLEPVFDVIPLLPSLMPFTGTSSDLPDRMPTSTCLPFSSRSARSP